MEVIFQWRSTSNGGRLLPWVLVLLLSSAPRDAWGSLELRSGVLLLELEFLVLEELKLELSLYWGLEECSWLL